jgi:hypothetical protein
MITVVEERNPELVAELRTKLLAELKKVTVPKLQKLKVLKEGDKKPAHTRSMVIGEIGRNMHFGYGDTRRGIKDYVTNARYPDLMKALVEYGNAIVPVGFHYNGITLNHNVKAKKHKDSKNFGDSYITGLGNYTGGTLNVYSNDTDCTAFDLLHKVVGFNGSELWHETNDFEGDRYTIIYYKQKWSGSPTGYTTVGN